MKLKNGFTLMELLAVIVVLGFLLTISVPKLREIIDSSKEKAREQDGELFLRALSNEIYAKKVKENFNPNICSVTDGVVTCDGEVIDIDKPNNKINGLIYLNDGEIANYDLTVVDTTYSNVEYTNERCFKFYEYSNYVSIGTYYYYIDNDSNNDACPRDVVIPSIYKGKKVEVINGTSFENKNLTSVFIPYNIKTIFNRAFYNNKLTSLIIPSSVIYIETSAFEENKLTNVIIPNSVESINNSAFCGNKLTEVVIPNSVKILGDYAFAYNNLTSVEIPDSVEKIGEQAFAYNNLTSIIIPDTVEEIGEYAFSPNNLTSIEIGTNNSLLTSIGDGAFDNYIGEGYGPNAITSVRIHKSTNSIDLSNSGLLDYNNVVITWN